MIYLDDDINRRLLYGAKRQIDPNVKPLKPASEQQLTVFHLCYKIEKQATLQIMKLHKQMCLFLLESTFSRLTNQWVRFFYTQQ